MIVAYSVQTFWVVKILKLNEVKGFYGHKLNTAIIWLVVVDTQLYIHIPSCIFTE